MTLNGTKPSTKGYPAIIEQLRKEIDGGRYRTGEKLPSEKELCQRFAAGRSSVREALAALTYAGVVEARSGSGYYLIGNQAELVKDSNTRCSLKILVAADETWNIAAYRRLLAAGADGVILSTADPGLWSKHLRAVRQAANDLGITLPILASVAPGADAPAAIAMAVSANCDAMIVGPGAATDMILETRRIIEEQGETTPIFAWITTPAGSENILRAADGAIIDFPPDNARSRDILATIMRQGAATDKIILLAAAAADLKANASHQGETAALASHWQFDGVAVLSAMAAPDHLTDLIGRLRQKARDIEEKTAGSDQRLGRVVASPLANGLCLTAMHAVAAVKAVALVIPSETGAIPRLLSKFRPAVPVLAITPDPRIARQLKLVWGVVPLLTQRVTRQEDNIDAAIRAALRSGLLSDGDIVVGVTSGMDIPNSPNAVTLAVVGDIILRGQGIGSGIISGRVSIIKSLHNKSKSLTDRILVLPATEASHVKLIEQAAALVVEEGGLSSHAAIACLSLGKPVIVGATDATDLLLEDEQVTLDVSRGMVYRGWINLG
ncbi:MAG: pyruvate kinase alpha/beta domain-containing protein [Negativicutes bacterium]|nr:pyruvate kinase alpha/beta domain-containing protein [Negativicutes bacterium]MDR3591887.1 pyruvate kinase alpha/beta domain-containing protein [Negativicutes bacterium]